MKNSYISFDQRPLLYLSKTLQEKSIKKKASRIMITSQHEVYDDPQDDACSVNSMKYLDSVLITVLDPQDMPYLPQVMKQITLQHRRKEPTTNLVSVWRNALSC